MQNDMRTNGMRRNDAAMKTNAGNLKRFRLEKMNIIKAVKCSAGGIEETSPNPSLPALFL